MANAKNGRKKKLTKALLAIVILVLAIIVESVITSDEQQVPEQPNISNSQTQEQPTELTEELKLHMIDVGQADCFLFMKGDKVALVDCGTRSTGKDAVEYIKSLGITRIDYVFGTHPHHDHMGGMYDIITNFEVGKIIIPQVKEGQVTTNWYIKLMKQIVDGNYEVEYSKTGNEYFLGGAKIQIVWQSELEQDNVNNYSDIIRPSSKYFRIFICVRKHQILREKFNIHHTAIALLQIKFIISRFYQVLPHFVSHFNNIVP